jgi:predicted ATPase
MIPEGKDRCLLHLRIGKLVMYRCENHGMDPSLLLAANQMNHGVEFVVEEGQKVDLAALNLKAARLARARSAYVPASQYLSVARGVLGEDRWFAQYELALELANFGAEMEYCSANFVKCQELIDEVLAFSVSPQDRFRAYYVEIDSLRAQDRLLDALDLGFKVLAQFKISFPKKPSMIDIAVSLGVTSSKVPKFVDDILRLPLLTDKDKLACMKIMGISALCAFFLEKGREFTLLSLRMMHFTLRYGLSDMSALSLGTFGLIKIFTGKYEDGLAFGKLSLRLFKHMNCTECDAPSLFMVYCYTNHWHMPLETMLAPLQQACAHGIATSEIGFGLLAGYNRVVALASLGTPLDIVDNEIRAILEQCHEFRQDNVTRLLAPTHQAGLNLQGRSSFPLILTGTSMDQQSLTEEARMAKNTVLQYVIAFNQLKLGLHFQEWQLAADLLPCIEKYRKLSKGLTKHFTVYDFTLVAGISYAVLWRRSGKRMHLKLFQRYMTQSKGWLSSGLLQCEANYAFLLAEKAVFSNAGPIAIKRAYDEAIVKLEQAQLLHFRAFANERAGTVLQELKVFGDVVEYYTEAQALYYEYGAYAKVDQLERKIDEASARSLRPA